MDEFTQIEQSYGLPQGLLKKQMMAESGGRLDAVSPKGAQGPFQFMPATARQYGVNTRDKMSSAEGAARMLSDAYNKYGSWDKALAAYNWGQGNLDRNGMANAPAETVAYVNKLSPGDKKMVSMDELMKIDVPGKKSGNQSHEVSMDELMKIDVPKTSSGPLKQDQATTPQTPTLQNAPAPAPQPGQASVKSTPTPSTGQPGMMQRAGAAVGNTLQDFRQGASEFGRGILQGGAKPIYGAMESIPIPAVQKFAAKNLQTIQNQSGNQPFAQGVGEALAFAPTSMIPGGIEAKAAAVGEKATPYIVGLGKRIAGNAITGGAIAGTTAGSTNVGNIAETKKSAAEMGAMLGVAGGAASDFISSLGNKFRTAFLKGAPQTQDIPKMVQRAREKGYVIMPSEATGFSPSAQRVINPSATPASQANETLFKNELKREMGIEKSQPLTAGTLSKANTDIVNRFQSSIKDKNLSINAPTVASIKQLLTSKNMIVAQDLVPTSLGNSLDKAMETGKLTAKDWYDVAQQLKDSRSSAQNNVQRNALNELVDKWEGLADKNKSVKNSYTLFNRQYAANASVLEAVGKDQRFQATGIIDPRMVWASYLKRQNSAGGIAKGVEAKSSFAKTLKDAATLNLVPMKSALAEQERQNLIGAGLSHLIPNLHPAIGTTKAITEYGARLIYSPFAQKSLGLRGATNGLFGLPSIDEAMGGQSALVGGRNPYIRGNTVTPRLAGQFAGPGDSDNSIPGQEQIP